MLCVLTNQNNSNNKLVNKKLVKNKPKVCTVEVINYTNQLDFLYKYSIIIKYLRGENYMNLNEYESQMKSKIDYLVEELGNVRAGRANPQILNRVKVEYYGVVTPINQLASVSVPEPRQILIAPWDRNLIPEIAKAISKADIGINPLQDASGIRLMFPELNEARRKEIAKDLRELGENVKVAIRNIRRDAMDEAKKLQKDAQISEDELHGEEEKIQKLTDKYIEEVSAKVSEKEKEIMEV